MRARQCVARVSLQPAGDARCAVAHAGGEDEPCARRSSVGARRQRAPVDRRRLIVDVPSVLRGARRARLPVAGARPERRAARRARRRQTAT